MRRIIAGLALAAALTACGTSAEQAEIRSEQAALNRPDGPERSLTVTLPQCEEDEPYLVGKGDFDGVSWEWYECVHVDDVHSVVQP